MSKGLCYNFTVKPSNFVQILLDGYGHWLTISTIDAQEGEVYVFDSLYATYCNSFPTKCQVAALLQCQEASGSHFRVSVVFLLSLLPLPLALGLIRVNSESELRSHLMKSLNRQRFDIFPVKKRRHTGLTSVGCFSTS